DCQEMTMTPEMEKMIRQKFEINHFARHLGFELELVEPGHARIGVEVTRDLIQLSGVMHGGAIASLIDTAVAFAIVGSSDADSRFTTVELKINYLSSIRGGRATADARVIRNGRRIIVAESDVFDSEGRHAAKGLLTYIRLD